MRLLWLPTVLRDAGLTVHEYSGWRTRGLDSFGPVRGIICHGTAGSLTSTDEGELRVIAITGSSTATPPIAQLYLSRSGQWWVCASGTCTGVRTGWGGPLAGYGDDAVLQIEAQHHPDEPWSEVQYGSYVRGVAALLRHRVSGYDVTVGRVAGHGEHQPGSKTDPWFDMNELRRDVAAVMDGDDMQLTDRLGPAAGEYAGWSINNVLVTLLRRTGYLANDSGLVEKIEAIGEVDEAQIVAGVLAGLSPQAIADAIGDDMARDVVDLLKARLEA